MADDKLPKDKLNDALRRLFRPQKQETSRPIGTAREEPGAGLDLSPRSPFDALLDQRLKSLEAQVDDLKGRVNGLLAAVVAAVVIQVVLSLFRT